jgi:hypothetical protein
MRKLYCRSLSSILLILIVTMVGLLVWNIAGSSTAAQTQESKKVQRWEYCYMSAPYSTVEGWKVAVARGGEQEIRESDQTGAAALNKLGADGWELVGATGDATKFFLKRPK